MKLRKITLLFLSLFCFSPIINADNCNDCCDTTTSCCDDDCTDSCSDQYGKTFFHAREANQNTALGLVGGAQYRHLFDKDCTFYGVFTAAVGYERSHDACNLGKVFSFDSSGNTVFSADSNTSYYNGNDTVAANSSSNTRATDFGLSTTYSSTLIFRPKIQKIIVDFDLFVGLDECLNGLWTRIEAPIIHANYDLNPCVSVTSTSGGVYYPAGFIDDNGSLDLVPYSNIETAWNKQEAFGDVNASGCGKLPCQSQRKTKVGGISLDLGYDFFRCERFAFGVSLHGVIPTANAPRAEWLFNPIAGTYNWQLGATLNAQWTPYCCETSRLSAYFKMVMTHMFKDRHVRMFGLNVGDQTAGNSWLLLKQFDADGNYDGVIRRASSMLGRSIKVGNDFMTDLSLMIQYRRCSLDFSLGYNFWYRSKDKCDIKCSDTKQLDCKGTCYKEFIPATYGIKGVSSVTSPYADNFYAKGDSNIHKSGTSSDTTAAATTDYVLEADVTPCVALAPSAYSNKIFGYIGYHGESDDYQPFFGIMGSYEWGQSNRALDQAGVYINVGVSF